MKGIIHGLMVRLFVRLGSKCFNSMAVYSPGGDRGHIKAIHWAVNDYHLHSSVAELAEEHRGGGQHVEAMKLLRELVAWEEDRDRYTGDLADFACAARRILEMEAPHEH